MKQTSLSQFATLVLSAFISVACSKGNPPNAKIMGSETSASTDYFPPVIDNPPVNPGTSNSVSAATLTGSWQSICALNPNSQKHEAEVVQFGSSGSVQIVSSIDSQTGCARKTGWTQTGTYSIVGANATDSTLTNVTISVTYSSYFIDPSQSLAVYNSGTGFCGRNSGWQHGENSVAGTSCARTDVFSTVMKLNPATVLHLGGSTGGVFPTTTSESYTKL
jgi:hypothetical protein